MVNITEVVPKLDLDDPRRATETVHRTLRELIYSGALPAGLTVSQVELSEALGVSRTPTREAFRMLQEEGLIDAQPNRRGRIAGFDAADVDATCAMRITLESLAMSLSFKVLDEAFLAEAREAIEAMEVDDQPGVSAAWHAAHRRFHRAFTVHAPGPLVEQLLTIAQRSDRYVRQAAVGVLHGWSHGRDDHRRILELATERRTDETIFASCQHFARTAVLLLADVAPEFEPVATRTAIGLVARSLGVAVAGHDRPAQ